ncbi:hypothetical protein DYB34_009224, partial [Aphanomyces astaci]
SSTESADVVSIRIRFDAESASDDTKAGAARGAEASDDSSVEVSVVGGRDAEDDGSTVVDISCVLEAVATVAGSQDDGSGVAGICDTVAASATGSWASSVVDAGNDDDDDVGRDVVVSSGGDLVAPHAINCFI